MSNSSTRTFFRSNLASCKWRNKLVSKRRKLEVKATDLIKKINEKMLPEIERCTIQHFNTGVFPWDPANKG